MAALELRTLLTQIVASSVDGIAAVDGQGQIALWSRSMERIFGIPRVEAVGRAIADVLPFWSGSAEPKHLAAASAGQPATSRDCAFSVPERSREGWLDIHYHPLTDQEQRQVGVLLVIEEITGLKRVSEALRQARLQERELLVRLNTSGSSPAPPARGGTPADATSAEPGETSVPAFPPAGDGSTDSRIFDRDTVLGYLGGEDTLMREIAEISVGSLPRMLEVAAQAVERRDRAAILAQAQHLKGTASGVGGHRATWAAAELERAAQEGRLDDAPAALRRLDAEMRLLAHALYTQVLGNKAA